MRETVEYFAILDRVERVVDKLPQRAARVAVNFSNERFRQQNWVDNNTEPWPKRKPVKGESRSRAGRAVLVNTARLKRGNRTINYNSRSAKIGNDTPYAGVHNEGFRGRVEQNVRKHTRTRQGREHIVESHSRTIRQHIPRRRFMGQSAVLDERIRRMMTAEIVRAIRR